MLIHKRGIFSVHTEWFECDLYEFVKGNETYMTAYTGTYMAEYPGPLHHTISGQNLCRMNDNDKPVGSLQRGMDWMKIKTRMQIKKTLMQMVTCTSAVLVISAMPVYGADGWQQDTAQQWFYMEHDKKVVNRWVTWADGTPRYLGGNGLIVTNNWVNAGGGSLPRKGGRFPL